MQNKTRSKKVEAEVVNEQEDDKKEIRKLLWKGSYSGMEIEIYTYPYGYIVCINDRNYYLSSMDGVVVFLQDELLKREALERFEYREGIKLSEVVQWFKNKREEIRKWTQEIA